VSVVSRIVVPLICCATVEFHQTDRVMRQFRYRQHIPHDPCNLDEAYKEDMCGRTDRYLPQYHWRWITNLNNWQNHLIQGVSFHKNGHLCDDSTYMQWYITHTIRYVSPIKTTFEDNISSIISYCHFFKKYIN